MRRLLQLLLLLASASVCHAATVYVAQSSGMFTGGTACNGQTAVTVATYNSGGGNPVVLCGTITTQIVPPSSGVLGTPILITFDTGASLTASYWSTGGAINLTGLSYITVDGGTSCGWVNQTEVACNGIITATANTNVTNNHASYGIELNGSSNIEIRNLGITNMLVQAKNASTSGNSQTVAIDIANSSNVLIHNNFAHDAHSNYQVQWSSGTSSNLQIYNNVSQNACTGYTIASGGTSPAITTILIHDNESKDGNNWDTVDNSCHQDHLHGWAEAAGNGGAITGMQIYNNFFHGDLGCHQNGYIYFEADVGSNTAAKYFNNLLVNTSNNASCTGPWAYPPSGYIGLKGGGTSGGCAGTTGVYNNTIVGNVTQNNQPNLGILLENSCTGADIRNNIVNTVGTQVVVNDSGSSISTANNNDYFSLLDWNWKGVDKSSFFAWQSACSCDANSITSNPNLNASYAPNGSSPAIGAALNLTSLGITKLNSDLSGYTRPTSALWTMGAYNALYSISNQQLTSSPFYPNTLFTNPIPAGASNECWNPSGGAPVVCGPSSADLAVVNNIFGSADSPIYFNAFSLQCLTSTTGCSTNSYGNAFYYTDETYPVYRVNSGASPCPTGPNATSANCASAKYFHMPPNAVYDACTNDEGISIWDQSSDIDSTPGGRIVSSFFENHGSCPSSPPTITGGCTATTPAQADVQSNCQLTWAYNGVNFPFNDSQAWGNGLTSDGSANNVYELREQEIMQNVVNHALGLSTACLRSASGNGIADAEVFPATGNAIGCSFVDANRPLNGNLFWIDSGFNCSALPAWQAPVCKAMQTYGGYVHATQGGSGAPLFVDPLEGGMAHTLVSLNDAYFNNWIIANGGLTCPGGGYPKVCTGPVDSGQARLEVVEDSASTSEKIIAYFFQMPGLITGHHLHILDPCVAKSMAGVAGGCVNTTPPTAPNNFSIAKGNLQSSGRIGH